ncbi:MAG TPA: NYN domain-containing protein [Gaiellaceae bacterium]|nr:NYN domain-containing protein [Gaiellaceae bacterium]
MIVALVDASNVRRSTWPNIASDELPALVARWAESEGVQAVLVFDGAAPDAVYVDRVELVSTSRESADDRIADEAARLGAAGADYWLVTSDRGLRKRAAEGAARTIGGGTLARRLLELRDA